MRAGLAIAFLIVAEPASAHCYAKWLYPWPQPGCGTRVASRAPVREDQRLAAPLPPEAPPRLDFSIPTIQPPPEEWDEETAREVAIQKLREEMERK